MKFGVGQAVARVEDARLITGRGRYTDDINLPRQVRAVILRSPHAHAKITSIDTKAAKDAPGVLAVYTGADVEADGLGHLPCLITQLMQLKRTGGEDMFVPPRPVLVKDTVKFVGDYVAMVVAETVEQAKDAAEAIEVDYEELPSVTATAEAMNGAPATWDAAPDNVCFVNALGDKEKVAAAFEKADHVTKIEIPITRIAQNPMEPRAALGHYDKHEDRYTLYSGNQGPHDLRKNLAQLVLKIPETQLRVVSPDMGGAFGMRSNIFPEMALVLWASKKLGRPVKWVADRTESFLADDHGRDSVLTVELALSKDGVFLGVRATNVANMGAYLSLFGPFPAFGNIGSLAGVYRTPAICVDIFAVLTNTSPVGPYRGAGRPEAVMGIEKAIDHAARELGMDRIALRRRNIIPPEAMPFQTGLTFNYDSGRFEENMDKALALADVAGFEKRRQESEKRGRLRGLGIANAIEQSAGLFDEGAEIRFDNSGGASVYMGTHSHGQGHETVFRQIIAEKLGLDFEDVRYVQGDTDQVPYGHGTFGSRSSGLGGGALSLAADKVIEKGRQIAGNLLEAAPGDIEFADGAFTVAGTDKSVTLKEVARKSFARVNLPAGLEPGLDAFATYGHKAPTFPNGCHVSEIEIDPETGVVDVLGYWVVDDVGTVLNPLLLKGQIQGGVVQGIGQILMERMIWEPETGQVLTGSFMDYTMPRADDVSPIEVESNPVPTPTNMLGVKGAGEAGTVGAMPCLMSALLDALAPLGIEDFHMPATPDRVWAAIRDAKG